MDPITQQQALATAGAAGGESLYVDDVFNTYVYEGTGSAQTITNDIDLAGEGGMGWIKTRSHTDSHSVFDTERGATNYLKTDTADQQYSANSALSAFNSDGFSLGGNDAPTNGSGRTFASWAFRKAPGFFDVVTYTGNGVAGREIAHNLGSVPGMVIVKRTNAAEDWTCYHRELWPTYITDLYSDAAQNNSGDVFDSTAPTSTVFTVGSSTRTNANGSTYVAYIFAHDDQSFGENGDQSIIKCGSYTGNGSAQGQEIDVGFEPQWILLKVAAGETGNWYQYDTMRGWTVNDSDNANHLRPNLTNGENDSDPSGGLKIVPTSTGFRLPDTDHNKYLKEYIYIAIRRPHKPPTAATEVFTPQATRAATDGTPSELVFTAGFPVDLLFYTNRIGGTNSHSIVDRMRGGNKLLASASTSSEVTTNHKFDSNEGVYGTSTIPATSDYGGLLFRRAPGFFDIVSYTGDGVARMENHNLGVAPEFYITKTRNASGGWACYHSALGATDMIRMERDNAKLSNIVYWNDTDPTATQFSLGTNVLTNGSAGYDYIAYLFATLPGISKVGSYTGTGSDINVDCGFTAGARFVLIKRSDYTGGWYVWDTARGIVTGNDPYVLFDTTDAEVTNTDYIDPLNAGFTVTSTAPSGLNASGGTYLFLAIA